MNKFIKGCLYVAGILTALGLVFFLLGSVFGGLRQVIEIGNRGEFNCASITPHGIHVEIGDFDIGDFSVGDIDEYEAFEDDFEDDVEESELIDFSNESLGSASDIKAIDVSLGAGELFIRESEDDQYRMEADHVYKVQCYIRDSVLHVRGVGVNGNNAGIKKQRIILYVPKGAGLLDTDIELGAGVGKIEGITTEELSVEVGAGELKGNDITAAIANIQVGAGSAELIDCAFGEAEYEVGLGSIYYQGGLNGSVDVNCNMGNVELNLDGLEEDYDYRIDCAMGSVNVGGRQFAGISGEKRIDNGAPNHMEIDCSMGNITVQFEE